MRTWRMGAWKIPCEGRKVKGVGRTRARKRRRLPKRCSSTWAVT